MTVYTRPLAEATDVSRVGGKALNLGRLIRAGFHVPGGFVIETAARTATCTACVEKQILAAYEAMGGGTVAVRSSATAEDAATASMAGQYETILNVPGGPALLAAVARCYASLSTPRVAAYIAEHDIDAAGVGMAVVVQRQVAADVAGVLFTAAPDDAHPRQMLIEAAWGLGESVVSGRVQPDVLRVSFDDGRVIEAAIAVKRTAWTAAGEGHVAADRQAVACLTSADADRLWKLGRQAETHFGCPQDLEWAIAGDEVFLLQSRPITTHADAAVRSARIDQQRDTLRHDLASGHGPWVLHNLAETLPHPTTLTWDVIRRFMSGGGAYGTAYHRAGFSPDAALADTGFLDLIGGRIYMDTARAPRMFSADFPFAYDAETLRRSPDASQTPPTKAIGSMVARLRGGRLLQRAGRTLRTLATGLDDQLRATAIPAMRAYVDSHRQADLKALSSGELTSLWHAHERVVVDGFGADEITAGLAAGMALDDLRTFLAEHLWDADAEAVALSLSSGGPANASVTSDAALHHVASGEMSVDEWIAAHGHRGANEMGPGLAALA